MDPSANPPHYVVDDGTTSYAGTLSAALRRALEVHHLATLEQEAGAEALRREALRVDGDFYSCGLDIRRLREELGLAMSQASLGKVAREERAEAVVARDEALRTQKCSGGSCAMPRRALLPHMRALPLNRLRGKIGRRRHPMSLPRREPLGSFACPFHRGKPRVSARNW